MPATASFVIDFGGVEGAYLTAELDSVKNNGKTSFLKGDQVHFRVSADIGYTIETSSGDILPPQPIHQPGEQGHLEPIENTVLTFIKGAPANVPKKIASFSNDPAPIKSTVWYGNNLGIISKIDNTSVQAALADVDALGIASINYVTDYNEHTLLPPATMTDIWHIIIYIKAVS